MPSRTRFFLHIIEAKCIREGTLLRKWVLDALARARLEGAITDYTVGEANLGEAAARGGVSVARMLTELDRRGIDTIDSKHFRASLENLDSLFGVSAELRMSIHE